MATPRQNVFRLILLSIAVSLLVIVIVLIKSCHSTETPHGTSSAEITWMHPEAPNTA